ncbi:membrane protein [Clostridium acetobutylicum]|nr:membrane protein [Clostridium acetobutylicum]
MIIWSTVAAIFIAVLLVWHFYFSDDNKSDLVIHGKVIQELSSNSKKNKNTSKANVINVPENKKSKKNKNSLNRTYVLVKILNGDYKGKVIKLENLVNEKTAHETLTKKGDEVLINIDEDSKGNISSAYIYDVVRYKFIFGLVAAFIILLSVVGGKKGVKSVIALAITAVAVLKIMIPLIIAGFNPTIVSIVICIVVSTINLIIISGKNKKTLAAIIGTSGGLILSALIATFSIITLRLSGLTDEEEQMVIYITQNTSFNFSGLLFAGILMGALGAVMDIGMSIASSINELHETNEKATVMELVKSGMNVGRDMMGTMANTLILAYAGGAMYVMIWISSYDLPLYRIINQDVIASELVKTLAGSIGLIFTIPLTAFCSAMILKREKVKVNSKENMLVEEKQ